ncbi:MAG: Uma2 family endonuclease [Cyanobacteria bacterium J06638_28]
MVQVKPKLKTFVDFLTYAEVVDGYYELTNGELIEMPPESDDNLYRALKLYEALKVVIGMQQIRLQGIAIAVPGQPKNRYPDLTVLCPEHPEQMRALGQAAITLEMAPPLLLVEIVSPGKESHNRDYIEKRNQYEWRGISEYWVLDPQQNQVTVFAMVEGVYEETVFKGSETIVSLTFPQWQLTADEMLAL